jgi:hypothetical protein
MWKFKKWFKQHWLSALVTIFISIPGALATYSDLQQRFFPSLFYKKITMPHLGLYWIFWPIAIVSLAFVYRREHKRSQGRVYPLEIEVLPCREILGEYKCEVLLKNINQAVSGFGLRLLEIDPPIKNNLDDCSTEQVYLPALVFSSKDNLSKLNQGQAVRFDIFRAKRNNVWINIELAGKIPNYPADDESWKKKSFSKWFNGFSPEEITPLTFREYVVTLESFADGVPTKPTKFRLSFSKDKGKMPFEFTKI